VDGHLHDVQPSYAACRSCVPLFIRASWRLVVVDAPSSRGDGRDRQLPGLAEEDEHYFRDMYDHFIRISDLIRQLPRPADQRDGRLPVDGLEPAQRGDEAAGRDRHDLPCRSAG
jgi:hypothetical protein